MKIGVTGSAGLLGRHAHALLHSSGGGYTVALATRDTFRSDDALDRFVSGLDGVLHLAGVNRGDDVEFGNVRIAEQLTAALRRTRSRPSIAYANSIHHTQDSVYGQGKRRAGELLEAWGAESGGRIGNFVLPHVFGEFGKPFYNSVVSTFCHQLAHNDVPRIDADGQLELLHALSVAEHLLAWLVDPNLPVGHIRLEGEQLTVSQLLARLNAMLTRYMTDGVVPSLDSPIDLNLFNTLRSYLYPHAYPKALTLRTDPRGELFEAIRTENGGQVFLSTTVPGVTRGNHWHMRKVERFLVVGGEADIRIRRLFSEEVTTFHVSGTAPAYIDIPTMHVHSITNTGSQTLQTLFWAHEIFDPARPDTYAEAVIV